MEPVRYCQQFALQCFRWALEHDNPVHEHVFVEVARAWLETARKAEMDPDLAVETVRERLH